MSAKCLTLINASSGYHNCKCNDRLSYLNFDASLLDTGRSSYNLEQSSRGHVPEKDRQNIWWATECVRIPYDLLIVGSTAME